MAKRIKKFLKKAAPLIVAGLGAAALAKRKRHLGVRDQDDAGLGVSHFPGSKYIQKKIKSPVTPNPTDMWDNPWGAKGGGIAKRGMGAAFKSGGRVKSMGIAKRGGGAAKR